MKRMNISTILKDTFGNSVYSWSEISLIICTLPDACLLATIIIFSRQEAFAWFHITSKCTHFTILRILSSLQGNVLNFSSNDSLSVSWKSTSNFSSVDFILESVTETQIKQHEKAWLQVFRVTMIATEIFREVQEDTSWTILKTEATDAPETSVKNVQSIQCHITGHCNVEYWKCFLSVTEWWLAQGQLTSIKVRVCVLQTVTCIYCLYVQQL